MHKGVVDIGILQKHKKALSGVLVILLGVIIIFLTGPLRMQAIECRLELDYEKMTASEEKRAAMATLEGMADEDKSAHLMVVFDDYKQHDKFFREHTYTYKKNRLINGIVFEMNLQGIEEADEFITYMQFNTAVAAEKVMTLINSSDIVKYAELLDKQYIIEHTLYAEISEVIIYGSQEKIHALEELSDGQRGIGGFMSSYIEVYFSDNALKDAFINNEYLFLNEMGFTVVGGSPNKTSVSLRFRSIADAEAAVYLLNSLPEVSVAQMSMFYACTF